MPNSLTLPSLTLPSLNRRDLLSAGLAASSALAADPVLAAKSRKEPAAFRHSLNTSTIGGAQKISLPDKIDIAAKAGYDAIEPWVREIDEHIRGGGSLRELQTRIVDHGLVVESSIGFFEWIVDDDARRAKGLEEARRDMALVQQIGGKRLAAPPVGATDRSDVSLTKAAERYRQLLELGDQFGVVPQAEIWGFSKTLGTLAEAAMVAIASGHPQACVLPDIFHLYKGGSAFNGLRLLSSAAFHDLHVNDYPAAPPREQITDAARVYPGDGVAPLQLVFRELHELGYTGVLSLELFNRAYWEQDPLLVARTGLAKMREVAKKALGTAG